MMGNKSDMMLKKLTCYLILGPPTTGKTTFICRWLAVFQDQIDSVVLVSNTLKQPLYDTLLQAMSQKNLKFQTLTAVDFLALYALKGGEKTNDERKEDHHEVLVFDDAFTETETAKKCMEWVTDVVRRLQHSGQTILVSTHMQFEHGSMRTLMPALKSISTYLVLNMGCDVTGAHFLKSLVSDPKMKFSKDLKVYFLAQASKITDGQVEREKIVEGETELEKERRVRKATGNIISYIVQNDLLYNGLTFKMISTTK